MEQVAKCRRFPKENGGIFAVKLEEDAHTVVLRNFYKVAYRKGKDNRRNNVKIISLHLLKEIIVDVYNSSDETDMSDICGHIVPIARIEPPKDA